MKINPLNKAVLAAAIGLSGLEAPAAVVAHYPFDADANGMVTETVSGNRYQVHGQFGAETAPGVKGTSLFLDGYTSYVGTRIPHRMQMRYLSVSFWTALQSYPVCKVDDPNPGRQAAIVTCIDDNARTGFGFYVGYDGQYSFQVYINGEKAAVNVPKSLPRYRWNCLTAVVDGATGKVELFNNGETMVTKWVSQQGDIVLGDSPLHVAQDEWEMWLGDKEPDRFRTSAYGGLIDEMTIYDELLSVDFIKSQKSGANPVLTTPAARYADDRWHPRYHGCPTGNWTNEPHGLVWADGRYHIFFQKNAQGPYMARLHWGHLSSPNLYDWQEERIALTPGDRNGFNTEERFHVDMKGCWSGCVFTDPEVTGGRPAIFYTAVDYAKARIVRANPRNFDNSLLHWEKDIDNIAVDGRHWILSDDFRDPYIYRNGDKVHMIVGGSRYREEAGRNTSALALYTWKNGTWEPHRDDTAYWAWDFNADGAFMEMPSMTKMPGDVWLMVYSPFWKGGDAKCLYRTGRIDDDGRFVTDDFSKTSRPVDLFGKEGYGFLSPSIIQRDGRTIAIGLVPDKLGSHDNIVNGWAHCYSAPREWYLDSNRQLCQKPAAELEGLRTSTSYGRSNFNLNGSQTTGNVKGRQAEVRYDFVCGSAMTGIRFFKNSTSQATLAVDPNAHLIELSLERIGRIVQDGPYQKPGDPDIKGIYRAELPDIIAPGKEVNIALYIDNSIIDIFVNDRYAASVRVFPDTVNGNGTGIEAFADGSTQVKSLQAWTLKGNTDVTPSGTTVMSASQASRVAILLAENSEEALNPQERAALELFRSLYPNGLVIYPNQAKEKLSTWNVGTIWVHIDREGIGYDNMPAAINKEVIELLRLFYEDGGNLLLTKQATQLVHRIGRVDGKFKPTKHNFGDGAGETGTDVWTVNAQIGWALRGDGQCYDHRSHPIYDGMMTSGAFACETYALLGTGDRSEMIRENHNCLWDLNAYSYTAGGRNTVEMFQNETNSTVIGTWGHVVDHAVAGIIEFHPLAKNARARAGFPTHTGIILANGLAAYELAPRQGANSYTANVDRLGTNSLRYLVERDNGQTLTGINSASEDTKPALFPVDNTGVGYSGMEPGTVLTVVGIDGRTLSRTVLSDASGSVEVPYRGVVIARAGETVAKMILK